VEAEGIRPERRPETLRPLDHQRPFLTRLVYRKLLKFRRIFYPVQVDMPERDACILIGLDDRESGARHLAGKA
jgi:hypothetical protein